MYKDFSNEIDPLTPEVRAGFADESSYGESGEAFLGFGYKSSIGKSNLVSLYWIILYGINKVFFWLSHSTFWILWPWRNNDDISQLSWIKSENAMFTEVNHNQMNKGNKIKKINALHQMNLKEIPLDLLSALPETQEVALIVSKTKKKISLPIVRDVSLLIFIFNFYFYKYS